MESIRRRIKIFWLDHRDPILFYTIMIAGIIIIVQILNQIAISRSAEKEISKEPENNVFNLFEDILPKTSDKDIDDSYEDNP